ncbi:hypothetical protein GQ600_27874 [Phytophthora cactorum]|nr:hypothetical protein GQ600_27874 [Phytophthora cactorum]
MESPEVSRDDRMATQVGRRAELQKLSNEEGEWTLYRTLCQFRLGYFSFLVLMCILMFSVTFLMEIFFAIFLPAHAWTLLHQSSRLFLDAIDTREGSLANFRLSLCVCIHYLRHCAKCPTTEWREKGLTRFEVMMRTGSMGARQQSEESGLKHSSRFLRHRSSSHSSSSSEENSPSARWKRAFQAASTTVKFNTTHFDGPPLDFSTLVITDVLCPFVFELITMWTFMAIYLGVWMICHFCSARNRKMREFVSNYRRRYRDMQRELLEMENEKRAEHLWLVSIGFRAVEQFQTSFFTFVEDLFEVGSRIERGAARGDWQQKMRRQQRVKRNNHCRATKHIIRSKRETGSNTEGACDPVTDANETQEDAWTAAHACKIGEHIRELNLWSKFSYDRRLRILCPIVILSAISHSTHSMLAGALWILPHSARRYNPAKFPQDDVYCY